MKKRIIYTLFALLLSTYFMYGQVDHERDKLSEDTTYAFSEGVCRFSENKKWGFMDSTGKVIMRPVLDQAYDFKNGVAWVKKDNLWGSINKKGSFIVKPQYDNVSKLNDKDYTDNRCLLVKKNKQYGLVDIKTGEVLLPIEYKKVYGSYSQGYDEHVNVHKNKAVSYVYLQKIDGKSVLIDMASGLEKVKIPKGLEFEDVLFEDYFSVYYKRNKNVKGIMHYKDGLILDVKYRDIERIVQGNQFYIKSRKEVILRDLSDDGDFYFVYNLEKRRIIGESFLAVKGCHVESPCVKVKFKNNQGAILNLDTEEYFGYTGSFSDIVLPFWIMDPIVVRKYGEKNETDLYDLDQNLYKAPPSETKIDFAYGYAPICQNGKYGYINSKGEIVIPCLWYYAGEFKEYKQELNGKTRFLNLVHIAKVYNDEESSVLDSPIYLYVYDDNIAEIYLTNDLNDILNGEKAVSSIMFDSK